MPFDVRPPADDGERDALIDLLCVCFGTPQDSISVGMERVTPEHQRVLVDGDRVLGGLWQVPMGQWFGGRSVPIVGIAAVGIEAAARGTGAGDALMAGTVRELHDRRVPLSCLYPATVNFYRRTGYELAGSRYLIELPLAGLHVKAGDATLRPGGAEDFDAMAQAYAAMASSLGGHLDRGRYCWERARQPRGETARHWLVEEGGAVTGYVSLIQKSAPTLGYELHLSDAVASTTGAVQGVLAFLSGQRSLSPKAVFSGGDRHPLLLGLSDWSAQVTLGMHWMLRVTHVESALAARGWAPGVSGEVSFELVDTVIPDHAGPVRLAVSDGAATVERSGGGSGERGATPATRLDVRGLAALYSGFLSPLEVRRLGLIDGPPEDLATLGRLFAGPSPSMVDMF
jgi:predicted acetyltransferase